MLAPAAVVGILRGRVPSQAYDMPPLDFTQTGNGTLARACTICSRAKTKCLWNDGDNKCERCHRLSKDCKAITAPRKQRSGVRSKHELLARKLDRLESLLQSAQGNTSTTSDVSPSEVANAFPSPESLGALDSATPSSEPSARSPVTDNLSLHGSLRLCSEHHPQNDGIRSTISAKTSYSLTGTRSSITHSAIPNKSLEPSSSEAETCLKRFRDEMLPKFPFLVMPESMSAAELRERQPFLWLSIMSISGRDTRQQRALGNEVRLSLGREMLVEGKNNFDLLLGVLITIAWGQYHAFEKPIASTLIHVAHALLGNLFLTRPKAVEQTTTGPQMLNYTPRGCPRSYENDCRTMHERRALLGFYLLSVKTSSYFQRSEPITWTPYFEECSRVLEHAAEQPGDLLLVHLAKLQLITEKAAQAVISENMTVTDGLARVPPVYHYKNLESELMQVRRNLPTALQDNITLHLQFNQVNLSIHEIAISNLAPIPSTHLSISRLDFLNTCFATVKDSFDHFFDLPTASITLHPFWTIMQFGHCIITLFRLSTLESPDIPEWDRAHVRATYDLSTVLDRMQHKLGSVKEAAGYDVAGGDGEDQTMFSLVAQMFRGFKAWWDHKVESEKAEERAGQELNNAEVELGDAWFGDFLANGDFAFDPIMQMQGF